MKNLSKAIKFTLIFCVFISICYIFILWLFAQIAGPGQNGNAETVTLNGKIVGAANVGQNFTQDIYFWGRPSCAGNGYEADKSAGSNKGVSNQEYLDEVQSRIDTFLIKHPYFKKEDIPAEMVTASGSGLDPNITPKCAYIQIKRVAEARGISEDNVKRIVTQMIEKPFLGLFGTEKINVLKLNVKLEEAYPYTKDSIK